MCVTDCHGMTLAIKVVLNPNTTNQNNCHLARGQTMKIHESETFVLSVSMTSV